MGVSTSKECQASECSRSLHCEGVPCCVQQRNLWKNQSPFSDIGPASLEPIREKSDHAIISEQEQSQFQSDSDPHKGALPCSASKGSTTSSNTGFHEEPATLSSSPEQNLSAPEVISNSGHGAQSVPSASQEGKVEQAEHTSVNVGNGSATDVVLAGVAAVAQEPPADSAKESTKQSAEATDTGTDIDNQQTPTDSFDPSKEKVKMMVCVCFTLGFYLVSIILCYAVAKQKVYDECVGLDEEAINNLDVCKPCNPGGIFLPLLGDIEQRWNDGFRAILYLLGLAWMFIGIALICDQFMAAIEEITATEKVVWIMDHHHNNKKHKVHVKVWNDTVANLTLMALGSSAPEILLSVIELMAGKFFCGDLGPSVIVGSASFNLLVIIAVCVMAIPAGEDRKIAGLEVFSVTCTMSLVAYFWLLFILQVTSQDRVELWESLVTFAGFPLLVIIAFMADKGMLGGTKTVNTKVLDKQEAAVQAEAERLTQLYGKNIDTDTIRKLVQSKDSGRQPSKDSNAGSVPNSNITKARHARSSFIRSLTAMGTHKLQQAKPEQDSGILLGFEQPQYVVLECAGSVQVVVQASRKLASGLEVRYRTVDASAKAGSRYGRVEGSLKFGPDNLKQAIDIPIIDDEEWEEEEFFTVELLDLQTEEKDVRIGEPTTVTILNDDHPGLLKFESEEIKLEGAGHDIVEVIVHRKNGQVGSVTCAYTTQDVSATAGKAYEHVEGTLEFNPGESFQTVRIPLLRKEGVDHAKESFKVVLSDATGGAKFDPDTDGGEDRNICEIVLEATGPQPMFSLSRCFNRDKWALGMDHWSEQFEGAFYCGGSPENQSTATCKDWLFHCLSLLFKVICAFCPPSIFCGGWALFFSALGVIGSMTAIVADMASLLGCCLGIPNEICAITLVALGTSLPDTFASKVAAVQEETADNSIGNVTGSNSVNVFLGLGLPWTIGSIYWGQQGVTPEWKKKKYRGKTYADEFLDTYPDGGFMVPAGSLGFSVTVFALCAVCCVALLVFRRKRYGAELGGPVGPKKFATAALVSLWFLYISLSIWQILSAA